MCLTKMEPLCSCGAVTGVVSIIGPICSGFAEGVTSFGSSCTDSFEGASDEMFSGGVGGTAVLVLSEVLLVQAKMVDKMSWWIMASPIKMEALLARAFGYSQIRRTNLGFEIDSQEEVLDLFPIEHFLKKVWWSHIDEVK